ncbi:MAG: superoxide dismutase [Candidatus Ryanbacteria bacterium CG10_big_fil_rev_8_21_14_0_10_43_42]|uniref:superoxide dismutase n=1 Tax=Candidatus Ryanbacteria bacterium CG10_big_fil_rev_8_21_14_0_10_43_42 TaxID=1974864 RepID=A0A2M8KX07_9BACT|nr:MAG: superoxide dismutase [Candidatus Ryanbacteria bacterium CG10_big_fil_rev_8_21_14_0_10_43_42]
MREVKPLAYKELDGISEKQLAEHHNVLYAGYVKKTTEIEEKIKTADTSAANGVYSEFGELKREETFAVNGVKLHEGYFDNMIPNGSNISGPIKTLIERDFGSYDAWEKEFKATGIAGRGWAVLGYDLDEKKLRTVLCDAHNHGGVWNMVALLIMDIYEHAYFIDYGTARKTYIESFFKNINWEHVNGLLEKYGI